MKKDGQDFLEKLASFPPNTFERRFLKLCSRLGLVSALDEEELSRLYRAAFRARLCNLAFNGLGGCGGEIKPEQEGHRIRLERDFMMARDRFFSSTGYKSMRASQKAAMQTAFLVVAVAKENLAA